MPVELVVTGDRPMTAEGDALVKATREALLNAVRHGRPPVTVYVEVGATGAEVFVRDHGAGFELRDVAEDRLGVRESILGRMSRAGGTARIRRLEHGTEIALSLPPLARTPGAAERRAARAATRRPATRSATRRPAARAAARCPAARGATRAAACPAERTAYLVSSQPWERGDLMSDHVRLVLVDDHQDVPVRRRGGAGDARAHRCGGRGPGRRRPR